MKSILMSKPPKQVANILNGKQTILITKTAPKCGLPVTVYIYCTKRGVAIEKDLGLGFPEPINGRVVAKFTLTEVEELKPFSLMKMLGEDLTEKQAEIADKACMGWLGIHIYADGKSVYLWHISDLVVFDEPKKLENFYSTPKKINGLYGAEMVNISLSKSPRSWCYVEEN